MDGNFWLLLLIFVIAGLVGGTLLFLMRYARLKENVNRTLKDSQGQLFRQREKIRACNREFLGLFPGQEGGRGGGQRAEVRGQRPVGNRGQAVTAGQVWNPRSHT